MALIIVLAGAPAVAENLLINPGFEAIVGDAPVRWDRFVMPREGSFAAVDDEVVAEGEHSVMLRNEKPYEKEPANNWSQRVVRDLGGRRLYVSGRIKTDAATEAAIWVQCFHRQPLRMLSLSSTGNAKPIVGTQDWTPVEMEVDTPAGTDCVVLRCVLLGQGTAWFDSLNVDDAPPATDMKGAAVKEPEKSLESATSDAPSESKEPVARATDSQKVSSALVESQSALVETNRTMRQMNESLLAQIDAMQEELRLLREELAALRRQWEEPAEQDDAAPPFVEPTLPPPPLVPHGQGQIGEVR